MLLPLIASATYINGINYDLNSSAKMATVIEGSYSGNVYIPSQVTYYGVTYTVNIIDREAFYGCSGLTSVTIPNGCWIGKEAHRSRYQRHRKHHHGEVEGSVLTRS